MNYFIAITFGFIVCLLINNFIKKKRTQKFKESLYNNWGKEKKQTYYNFFVISKYFNNNRYKDTAYHILSEKSKVDFDIDDIFKFVDRTSSKIGQQYLYFKLRTISSIEELKKFDKLTNLFQSDKKLSISCQLELSKLNNNNSYYLEELVNDKSLEKPKHLWLVKALTITAICSIILLFFYPIFSLVLIPVFSTNLIFHYKKKHSVTFYLNGVNQLSKALKVGKKISENLAISSHFKDISFIKKIKSIQFKTEFIAFEKNVNNEYLFVVWFLVEMIKVLFNVEYLVFYSFLDSINKERKNIENLFVFIGKIDAAISTASLKSGVLKTCTPNFNNNHQLHVSNIYHPLIKKCIRNTVHLSKKSMLLTGSNMSGKTTFIRTIAINSILAQTLNICFADAYSAPFYKIYSSIRITDDLLENTSYYLQEVLTIQKLIEASKDTNPCLFVLDEIFKGTNTIERISGGKAILSYLNKEQHTVLVSTHDIELTELLEKDNYNLYHFNEQIKDNNLFFDHQLKKGKLKTRNAIKILSLYQYPPEIIKDAKNIESTFFS